MIFTAVKKWQNITKTCYEVLCDVPDSSAIHKMVRRHLNLDGLKQNIYAILLKIILFLLRKSVFLADMWTYSDWAGRLSDTGSTPYFLCTINVFGGGFITS